MTVGYHARRMRMTKVSSMVLFVAAVLAGCGSNGPAARDGAAGADGPRPDAHGDAVAETHDAASEAGADGPHLVTPVVLARAPGCGAARLALAGGTLYWTERATGAVKKLVVTSDAGPPTLVASNQPSPGPIAADDTAVYWSNEGDRTIRTAPLGGDGGVADGGASDGGAAAPLLTATAVVSALAAGDGVLYYSAGASTYEVPRAGGASKTLATFATCRPSTPGALAVGAGYLYQTTDLLQFITRERTDGTQLGNNPCVAADAGAPQIAIPETVTHTQGALLLDALYVTASEVVWADHTWIGAKTVASLAQATSRDVAQSAGSNLITGFVVTGASVYLAENDDPGGGPTAHTIQIAPLGAAATDAETPTATVIATGQRGARSFVADATHVYWATHEPSATSRAPDDCAIVSLTK